MLIYLQDFYPLTLFVDLAKKLSIPNITYFDGSIVKPHSTIMDSLEITLLPKHYNYSLNDCHSNDIICDSDLRNYVFSYYDVLYEMISRSELYSTSSYFRVTETLDNILRYWYSFIISKNIKQLLIKLPSDIDSFIIYLIASHLKLELLYFHAMPITKSGHQSVLLSKDIKSLRFDKIEITEKYSLKSKDGFMDLDSISLYSAYKIKLKYSLYSKFFNISRDYTLLSRIIVNILRTFRNRFVLLPKLRRYLNELPKELPLEKRFVYFPLQFQPEASTLPHAHKFRNAFQTILDISKCLNDDEILIVKEHPAYLVSNQISKFNINDYRSIRLYEKINNISNVIFINPKVKSDLIIERSKFVISYPGSTILESVRLNKNVLLLGEHIYSTLKGVFVSKAKISDSIEELRSLKHFDPDWRRYEDVMKNLIQVKLDENGFLDGNSRTLLLELLHEITF